MARVVVVGSGPSGLAAALHLSAANHHVVILESKQRIGGRATSEMKEHIPFGFGPHLLLKGGPTEKLVKRLSRIRLVASPVRMDHVYDTEHGAVRPASIQEIARFRKALRMGDREHPSMKALHLLSSVGLKMWQNERIRAFSRSKALVIAEGWAGIIGRLASALDEIGVYAETGCKVSAIDGTTVQLEDGRKVDSDYVVLACGPNTTQRLLPDHLQPSLKEVDSVHAATIDIALSSNPLGRKHGIIDVQNKQFILHLSKIQPRIPHPGSLISAAKIVSTSKDQSHLDALEGFLDARCTGWRSHTVHRRDQSSIRVGSSSENREEMFEEHRIFLAGDWLSSEFVLTDAAINSGQRCAKLIPR